MAYNITICLDKIKFSDLSKVVVWCHQNLCIGKDWEISEVFSVEGDIIMSKRLWLNNTEDLLALKLAVGLEFDVFK